MQIHRMMLLYPVARPMSMVEQVRLLLCSIQRGVVRLRNAVP